MVDSRNPDMSKILFDDIHSLCDTAGTTFIRVLADDYTLMCVGTKREMIHVKCSNDVFDEGFLRKKDNELEIVTESETHQISELKMMD